LGPLLILLIILATTVSTASATDYTKVGVKVGDTADYTYSDPTETTRFHIEILQIAGTNVTISLRYVYPNNSEGPDTLLSGDLAGDNSIQQYLIAANLSLGDNIYYVNNINSATMRIDKTTTMIFNGQSRIVNHAKFTGIEHLPLPLQGASYSNEANYDKITGLLIESSITVAGPTSDPSYKASYITTLTSTTAFGGEPSPIAPLIATAGIAVAAVTLVAVAVTSFRRQETTTN
jgi:hypothetical protein